MRTRPRSDREASQADPIALATENWVARGWATAADGMALVTSVMRVQQLLLARVEAVLRPSGLTFARFEVLRLLAFSRSGTLPIGKIGERLQVHAASATNAVTRLQAAGLVTRAANPTDGRSILVSITGAGRRLVEEWTVVLNDEVFAVLPLGPDQHRAVFDGLGAVRQSFGDFDPRR